MTAPRLRRSFNSRRAQAWVLVLFVLSALTTTLALGVQASQLAKSPWLVLCTASDGQAVPGSTGGTHGTHDIGSPHCAGCLSHASLDAWLPAPAPHRPVEVSATAMAAVDAAARPTGPEAHPDAPPRAPPQA